MNNRSNYIFGIGKILSYMSSGHDKYPEFSYYLNDFNVLCFDSRAPHSVFGPMFKNASYLGIKPHIIYFEKKQMFLENPKEFGYRKQKYGVYYKKIDNTGLELPLNEIVNGLDFIYKYVYFDLIDYQFKNSIFYLKNIIHNYITSEYIDMFIGCCKALVRTEFNISKTYPIELQLYLKYNQRRTD